ncbi:MAG: phytanoyl-CoA dioxygenase family protein [Pseudomonadaceae bacterium]|nr:phytanoyl-CoA dioxygenase family protein [Pseudomonadaceae bacterium]
MTKDTADSPTLLNSRQMASFAARGFLMLPGIVPGDLNDAFLADVGAADISNSDTPLSVYGRLLSDSTVPIVPAGQSLSSAYPPDSAIAKILQLPTVSGLIRSLVGSEPVFDHHFLHITFPPSYYERLADVPRSQHLHQDSTIDTRRAFDVQLMYYPHEVTREMGGTRYVPGSHLRVVSEAAIGRYQNVLGQQQVICPAGSILAVHHGIWHGGGANHSSDLRFMFKIRLQPGERQRRLWDDSDLTEDDFAQRAIFWTDIQARQDTIAAILMRPEPWFEADTGRLEFINRIALWRYLLGDDSFDADYWLTRLEREFSP